MPKFEIGSTSVFVRYSMQIKSSPNDTRPRLYPLHYVPPSGRSPILLTGDLIEQARQRYLSEADARRYLPFKGQVR